MVTTLIQPLSNHPVSVLHFQGVLGQGAHLNFQGIDFQQVRALADIIRAIRLLAGPVQSLDEALELLHVAHFQVQLRQLHRGAEPQPLVGRGLQGIQGELVDGLQLRQVAGRRNGVQHRVDGFRGIVTGDLGTLGATSQGSMQPGVSNKTMGSNEFNGWSN